ncbi:unnamed protein product [Paramecium octaurelia]|uniref:Uncharacterized protein n=1 Tax=Paramecium octaurelia TaxID=43137 RepID=A0A8S1UM12_PAROT|nr:unnamed protein product [Paramecium octaurelia]CAD8165557.1 unnamed protein product [Paramecium octaurelia]
MNQTRVVLLFKHTANKQVAQLPDQTIQIQKYNLNRWSDMLIAQFPITRSCWSTFQTVKLLSQVVDDIQQYSQRLKLLVHFLESQTEQQQAVYAEISICEIKFTQRSILFDPLPYWQVATRIKNLLLNKPLLRHDAQFQQVFQDIKSQLLISSYGSRFVAERIASR